MFSTLPKLYPLRFFFTLGTGRSYKEQRQDYTAAVREADDIVLERGTTSPTFEMDEDPAVGDLSSDSDRY